jgi:type IV pilus assembly protein PilM
MAENKAVWGIDIGQAGLKAIRLKYAEQAEQALAVAFDYIPHPKILSQPDAIPKDLINQSLATFLERNDTAGDLISISLPGHSALARFIQLPPVESSKVSDVVKYEARQQIPFALEDVIWDFQTLGGGIEESGFMLGAEVGLFAMKKENVYESIVPFDAAKVEIEMIQIAPLAMHNFLCYDQLGVRLEEEFVAPEEYIIMLDMGTDNTTLLVTNGEKIWIRNVPLGGNNFTRALTKEMKLTFAKAEHLKCNATKSPDPRAVFQALRPVFNEYVSEIQRSIGYFSSVNREAKISKVIGVGNAFKLAGLQKFLQQNLQYEVERVETFNGVIGDTVLNAPVFQENIMSFVVPYGLALQTLQLTKIHTTLLPPEIAVARKIRRKKPVCVAAAATLLAGMAVATMGPANAHAKIMVEDYTKVEAEGKTFKTAVDGKNAAYGGKKGEHDNLVKEGENLVSFVDRRELWAEMYRSLNECLPRAVGNEKDEEDLTKIKRLNILSLTCKRHSDVKQWFDKIPVSAKSYMIKEDQDKPPTGAGYVVTVVGEHFYAGEVTKGGVLFVVDSIITNLKKHRMDIPGREQLDVRRLGISHSTIPYFRKEQVPWYPNGKKKAVQGGNRPGGFRGATPGNAAGARGAAEPDKIIVDRTEFVVEFVWIPTLPLDRKDEVVAPVEGTNPGAPTTPVQTPGTTPVVPGAPVTPGNVPVAPVAPGTTPAAVPTAPLPGQ